MCEGNAKCAQCSGAAAADGSMTEVSAETKSQVLSSLNAELYHNAGTEEEVNNAYAITMTYFEKNAITPSAEMVVSNKDILVKVIADPDLYLSATPVKVGSKVSSKTSIKTAAAASTAAGNTGIAGDTTKVSTGTKIANTATTLSNILGGIFGSTPVASGVAGGTSYSAGLGDPNAPSPKILGMSPVLFYTLLVVVILMIIFFVVKANKGK
jgi:hypothetical protein